METMGMSTMCHKLSENYFWKDTTKRNNSAIAIDIALCVLTSLPALSA